MKRGSRKKRALNLSEELGKAINLHQNGDFRQAEIIYKRIVQHSPNHPDALNMLGILYTQTGKLDTAIDLMRKSIKSAPGRPDYLFNLARAYHDRADLDNAIATYQEYLSLVPDDPEVLYGMGRVLHDKNDLEQAIIYYLQAIGKSPERVDYLNSLGITYRDQGDFEQAVVYYTQALKYQPNDFIVLNNLGETFHKLKKNDKAIACFRHALSVRPDYPKALNNLGLFFREEGKLGEAVDYFQKALSVEPGFAEAHYNLGLVLGEQDMFAAAANSFRQALSLKSGYVEAHYKLAFALYSQRMFEDAAGNLRLALSLRPEYSEAHTLLGSIYAVRGDFKNALASCKKALSVNPHERKALILMSSIQNCANDKDSLAQMESLFLQEELNDQQKRDLAFALGKAYADLADYDKSFFYLSEGNRLERGSYEYSIKDEEPHFTLIKRVYNEAYILKHTNEGNADNAPIFILGMPRSGTSLVEQILASHPDVYGAGELEDIPQVINKLTGGHSLCEVFEKISQSDDNFYELLAAEYLNRSRKHSNSAKHITDKFLHNYLFIGAICLALPNAKIIHCVRGPMDNCFSIYKNLFGGENKYAYDLQELGQYYLLYADLMKHWHDVFPGKIYDIKYENIIADQEGETRKLLRNCGLSWNDQCLSFYKTSRDVYTLSVAQVRKPIYKDSIQLWEKFRKHLGPLKSIISDER